MKIVLIPDKFKGSLSAAEVINALTKGIIRANPNTIISSLISSDGGDGFLDAVEQTIAVDKIYCEAIDPLGRPISAPYLYHSEKKTAYIELAQCSGMVLLSKEERNPLKTSTMGTGLQIKHALKQGAEVIYIGLGGSATNEGGIGIAHGLGFRFLDKNGGVLSPTGQNLSHIHTIDSNGVSSDLKNIQFHAVNDVNNPLTGPNGAAFVYARQKGADADQIKALDAGLSQLNKIVEGKWQQLNAELPGAGAAGGTAYGLKSFLGASFVKGIDFMFALSDVDKVFKEKDVDLIITGEGAIDDQTLHGKLIHGVLELAKKYNTPVIAVCGLLELDKSTAEAIGLKTILEIRDKDRSTEYSMKHAAQLVEKHIYEYLTKQ
jgi:glycerate kinase